MTTNEWNIPKSTALTIELLEKMMEQITGKKKCDHSKDPIPVKSYGCIDCGTIFITPTDQKVLINNIHTLRHKLL